MEKNIMVPYNKAVTVLIFVSVTVGLYLTSLYHYLLFHCIAEIFSIIIACAVFMISWNSKEHTDNPYLVYLGIAYLFIGVLDLFHTLGYKGMKIFMDYDYYANQLWIGARGMESLTLLVFFSFAGSQKKLSYQSVIAIYTVITGLILVSVFYWKIFPVCFVEGQGLTPFKKISEYIICLILLCSGFALYQNREEFDDYIRQLMAWTIILTIFGELAFTFYIDNYGFSNLVGHYLKIASFYLVYKAIIVTGFKNPFDLMFKKLKDSEIRYRNLFNTALVGIFRTTTDGKKILAANPAAAKIFGYDSVESYLAEFVPRNCYEDPAQRLKIRHKLKEEGKIDNFEFLTTDRSGNQKWVALSAAVYREENYIEGAVIDITENIENRRKIQEAAEREAEQRGKIEMAGSVLHDIGNAVTGLGTTATRLLGDKDWHECNELTKLEKLADQKREAFAAALGSGKEEAFITFVRELRKSLGTRCEQLHLDYQNMTKIISHINEILHLQRCYTRDGQAGQRAMIHLPDLLEDALAINFGGFEKRRISVRRKFPPSGLPGISGDRTRLIQVFLNLFKNAGEAFDASEKKDERILEISAEVLNLNKIRVRITDNAVGFEPEQAAHFFHPGSSTKQRESGFGLRQCRSVIEANRGTIWLESPGKEKGASVIIELPVTQE
jgi:PAS domain S-box-containing protein